MRKTVIAAAAIAIVGAGALAVAQTQTGPAASDATVSSSPSAAAPAMAGMRVSEEDRAVLLDARIGAVKAVLKLRPDQEKLWAPVEAMMRKRAQLRSDEARRMRDQMARKRDSTERDPIARMRARADRMAKDAELLHEFADAAQPLYASLNADQKRRVFLLMHRARDNVMGRGHGGRGQMRWRD